MSHGVTAVALSAGQKSVGCSRVQVLMLPGLLLLLLLIAIASPLPNPQTGSHIPQSPESRLQPYGRQSAFQKVTTRRDILFDN